jgi:hypothetical protein
LFEGKKEEENELAKYQITITSDHYCLMSEKERNKTIYPVAFMSY